MVKQWYVIHTYSGFEKKVVDSLQQRIRSECMEDEVDEILIPTEDIVELKSGKKVITPKKFFPGYILIRMEMSDRAWHVIKNTPRVTGFVSAGKHPTALPQEEVDKILNQITASAEKPKPKFVFKKGETVRIIDGPFNSFTGSVDEINTVRNTLKVMVTIFGRATPVELDFFQVEKI